MDGYAFVERTRLDPALRQVPSILVSSRSSAEDRQHGQKVGALAFITKGEFDQSDFSTQLVGPWGDGWPSSESWWSRIL